ncbi:MAG: twin-arginine translocase subunit TatC [Chloroflexi bacterium]|nr:twin-arginine translocase subunit TatC [Chloroflexota bacterium]
MRNFFRILWRVISAPFRLILWIFGRIFTWISNVSQDVKKLFTAEPEDKPITDTIAAALNEPKEFWGALVEHLDALRKHLFRALIVIILTTSASAFFIRDLLEWISEPVGGVNSLQAIEVTEPLGVVMRVALLSGFALALPYLTFELYLFIAPGLKARARVLGLITIPIAFLFFVGGMAFAYFVMMPAALPFLLNFMGIPTAVRPSSYIKFVTGLMFWIGIAFEFPLVIFAMAGMGIVRAKDLARQWRIAVVIIAVLAAAITPTIDPVNMGLVMGPMILLYFLSIGLAFIAQGRRERQHE